MAKVFQVDTGGTLTTDLVSYYKLEDINDFYSTNHLTNNGGATFVAGKVNNAVSLDGTSQFLDRANVLSAQTANISMFMWVYISGTSVHGTFAHNGSNAGDGDGFSLGVGNTNFDTSGNNLIGLLDAVVWMNFGTAIGTGWHFVGITRDATTWKGWIDNVQAANTFTNNPSTPTAAFTIGRDTTGSTRYFAGDVDELGFWNKELIAQEKTDLYNGGTGQTMIESEVGTNQLLNLLGVQ